MNWHNEKVVVFGGGGFLGRYIVEQLLALGCAEVKSFGRSDQIELEQMGVEVFTGNITDKLAVDEACKSSTIVFHTAAKAGIWGSFKDYFDVNVTGTENVIDACRNNSIDSLVYTSSPSVAYPPTKDITNITESEPYPDTYLAHYPKTKAVAEKLVLNSASNSLATVALRPHLIWGPRDPHLVPRIIERAKRGRLARIGTGNNITDMTYVENAAYAHIAAAIALQESKEPSGKAYFISDDAPVNIWSWIDTLLKNCDIPHIAKSLSYRQAYYAGAILEVVYKWLPASYEPPMTRFVAGQLAFSHYFDITAAKNDLKYSPLVTPETGLKKTIQWLKDSGMV